MVRRRSWNGTPRLLEQRGEVLTSAGNLPRLSLWRRPLDGSGPPVSLGIIGDYAVQSAVHGPSGRIVSGTSREQSDVLRFEIPGAPQSAGEPPVVAFLESTFIDRSPAYSSDGSRIAFISDRTGRRQLWVATAAGERPTEWTQTFEPNPPPPSWSPDGSKVAFTGVGQSGKSQLFVADAATRIATQVTRDALEYGHAEWSPDGRFLYAVAADKSVFAIYPRSSPSRLDTADTARHYSRASVVSTLGGQLCADDCASFSRSCSFRPLLTHTITKPPRFSGSPLPMPASCPARNSRGSKPSRRNAT